MRRHKITLDIMDAEDLTLRSIKSVFERDQDKEFQKLKRRDNTAR